MSDVITHQPRPWSPTQLGSTNHLFVRREAPRGTRHYLDLPSYACDRTCCMPQAVRKAPSPTTLNHNTDVDKPYRDRFHLKGPPSTSKKPPQHLVCMKLQPLINTTASGARPPLSFSLVDIGQQLPRHLNRHHFIFCFTFYDIYNAQFRYEVKIVSPFYQQKLEAQVGKVYFYECLYVIWIAFLA